MVENVTFEEINAELKEAAHGLDNEGQVIVKDINGVRGGFVKESEMPRYRHVKKNTKRYGDYTRYPSLILVMGTQEQAEMIAKQLSDYHPGCDYYYYVEEE